MIQYKNFQTSYKVLTFVEEKMLLQKKKLLT